MEKTSVIQTDLSKYNNNWYQPGGVAKRVAWFLLGRLFVNTFLPIPMKIKRNVLRFFGAKIADNVVIKPKVNIKYPWFLTVGKNVWIGEEVWIDNLVEVIIEDNVCLSQGAMLLTGNHNFKRSTFDLMVGEIRIEQGAWIGAKAVVCPGVTCRTHAVLTVQSVATKDLEPYGIYQGNPAVWTKMRIIEE